MRHSWPAQIGAFRLNHPVVLHMIESFFFNLLDLTLLGHEKRKKVTLKPTLKRMNVEKKR